jgi:hypothetical protein
MNFRAFFFFPQRDRRAGFKASRAKAAAGLNVTPCSASGSLGSVKRTSSSGPSRDTNVSQMANVEPMKRRILFDSHVVGYHHLQNGRRQADRTMTRQGRLRVDSRTLGLRCKEMIVMRMSFYVLFINCESLVQVCKTVPVRD